MSNVIFKEFLPMDDGICILGLDRDSNQTVYLHKDGKWRKVAVTEGPEGNNKLTGYFPSIDEAKRVLGNSQGCGFSQMAEAFKNFQLKK